MGDADIIEALGFLVEYHCNPLLLVTKGSQHVVIHSGLQWWSSEESLPDITQLLLSPLQWQHPEEFRNFPAGNDQCHSRPVQNQTFGATSGNGCLNCHADNLMFYFHWYQLPNKQANRHQCLARVVDLFRDWETTVHKYTTLSQWYPQTGAFALDDTGDLVLCFFGVYRSVR